VQLGKATGEILVENTNGPLDISVPGAQSIDIAKHSAHLKVPGKAQQIRLETTNGSIRIR
jgi:DUF4097 and DUF4098 domain-containing protein YvlB